ncbi:MAG: FAD-binding protein [Deltaproteobacteria bacterium]|nr:FAD-binding protein [Deltaproteobacteria bacterium]
MTDKIIYHQADVLVVGGGAAGAMAAIRAKECGADVLLVDKSIFGASGCAALASGAYITYVPGDDIAFHLSGRGVLVNQTQAIKAIYATYDVLKILDGWGVRFVKENGEIWRGKGFGGAAASGGLAAGLIGGGTAMMKVVRKEALRRGVRVLNRTPITDLLTSDGQLPTAGHVIGAIGFSGREEEIHVCQAKSVLMCAGGFNFGYKRPGQNFAGMPLDITSDGVAMQLRAGAVMGNMAVGSKYLQSMEFCCAPGIEHFTTMGTGWVNQDGVDVMRRFGESETEFTRRLSLGHAVALEMLEGGTVFLDGSRLTPDKVRLLWDVIPIIMQTFDNAGYEITRDRIPYIPVNAATYGSSHGGGAVVNEKSETSLPGLFAAGASSDGMNISPNLNLSWCMVLGWWAGEHAANYAKRTSLQDVGKEQIAGLSQKSIKHLNGDGLTFNEVHSKAAQALIDLGVITTDEKITKARNVLRELLAVYDKVKAQDRHDLVKVIGLRNSLEALAVILRYLLHRQESRGSVINSDHPETDNQNWLTLTKSNMEPNGDLKLWDDPIPHEKFYLHYRPKPGKNMHPFFKVVGRQVDSQK